MKARRLYRTNFAALTRNLVLAGGLFGVAMGAALILALLFGEALKWVI